jgi:hypothetical protein
MVKGEASDGKPTIFIEGSQFFCHVRWNSATWELRGCVNPTFVGH